MIWPSTESQEKRNAYTDWLLRSSDEQELAAEQAEEDAREAWRYRWHEVRLGPLGEDFCDRCGANTAFHDQLPYGRNPQ